MAGDRRSRMNKLRAKLESSKDDYDSILEEARALSDEVEEESDDEDSTTVKEVHEAVLKGTEHLDSAIELLGGEI